MLQDVNVNESQKDAEHWICTQWNLCKEEMLEEEAELISQGKDSILQFRIHTLSLNFGLKTKSF